MSRAVVRFEGARLTPDDAGFVSGVIASEEEGGRTGISAGGSSVRGYGSVAASRTKR
jgi:hypothetical protein